MLQSRLVGQRAKRPADERVGGEISRSESVHRRKWCRFYRGRIGQLYPWELRESGGGGGARDLITAGAFGGRAGKKTNGNS